MMRIFAAFFIFIMLVVMPLLFMDIMFIALSKLAINPLLAPFIVLLMFFGSLINIPVLREVIPLPVFHHPMIIWGLEQYLPNLKQHTYERVVAINVGGFVIPLLLVFYELGLIIWQQPELLFAVLSTVMINILVCYFFAQPIPKIGIVLPALIPGMVAAISALIFAPEMAPPVAFCAGVLGPIVGADLMRLNEVRKVQVGMASIGGAGTFDGIVISGLIAVLLA